MPKDFSIVKLEGEKKDFQTSKRKNENKGKNVYEVKLHILQRSTALCHPFATAE